MQQFRANLTRLRNSMATNLPDGNDIYDYKGVSKAVLLSAVDLANELSQGIQTSDESRFEVISLKRAGSELYKRLKDYIDAEGSEAAAKDWFNFFLNDLNALIEKTKLTYFIVAKNGLRDDQEITRIRTEISTLSKLRSEYAEIVEKAKLEAQGNIETLACVVDNNSAVKVKAKEILSWHEAIEKQFAELTEIHKGIAGWDKEIRRHSVQYQTMHKKIVELSDLAVKNNEALQTQHAEILRHNQEMEKLRGEHNVFLEQIKDTLGGANKVGMAASFKERKDELQKQQYGWQLIFVITMLMIFFAVLNYVIPKIGTEQRADILLEVALVSPLVWLGWFAAKQYGYISKIREDYAFKSAAAMAYEGHKKAARHVDRPLEGVLLEFSLFNMAQNPIRLYGDADSPASPMHDFFNNAINKLTKYNKIKVGVPSVASVEVEQNRKGADKIQQVNQTEEA